MGVEMDIYLILRIAIVGILVSILNQILKQSNRDELAFMTSLAGLILVLFWILPYITELFATIKDLFSML
jgi:stage III sporulation protein AC